MRFKTVSYSAYGYDAGIDRGFYKDNLTGYCKTGATTFRGALITAIRKYPGVKYWQIIRYRRGHAVGEMVYEMNKNTNKSVVMIDNRGRRKGKEVV